MKITRTQNILLNVESLSVWEIGFQLCGEDPDKFDGHDLPLNVKNTVRSLCSAILVDKLPVQFFNLGEYYSHSVSDTNGDLEYIANQELSDVTQGLHYRPEFLREVYINRDDYFKWLLSRDRELPEFWDSTAFFEQFSPNNTPMSEEDDNASKCFKGSRARDRLDKELCRAIAQTIWLYEPKLTIKAVIEHKAIQRFGNGRLHPGRDTIRNWINKLSPNKPENKG